MCAPALSFWASSHEAIHHRGRLCRDSGDLRRVPAGAPRAPPLTLASRKDTFDAAQNDAEQLVIAACSEQSKSSYGHEWV